MRENDRWWERQQRGSAPVDREATTNRQRQCLRPGLNWGPSVYKADALPLSHRGATQPTNSPVFNPPWSSHRTTNTTQHITQYTLHTTHYTLHTTHYSTSHIPHPTSHIAQPHTPQTALRLRASSRRLPSYNNRFPPPLSTRPYTGRYTAHCTHCPLSDHGRFHRQPHPGRPHDRVSGTVRSDTSVAV